MWGVGVGGFIRHREGLNQMTALRFKMEGGVGGWGWGGGGLSDIEKD